MNATLIDTLELSRDLKPAGFTETQADAVTRAVKKAGDVDLSYLSTKEDFLLLKSEFQKLDSSLKSEIRELELRMTIKLGGMIAVAVGLIAAMVKFL